MSSGRDGERGLFIHVGASGLMRQITDLRLLAVVSALLIAYEFRIMMDGRALSREQETVYAATPYISIHLPLMRRRRRR